MPRNQESIGLLASQVGDAVGDEVALYVELVRAELARDAAHQARNLWPALLAIPLGTIGHLALSVAMGLSLSMWLAPPLAWCLVGLLNLGLGAAAMRVTLGRYRTISVGASDVG